MSNKKLSILLIDDDEHDNFFHKRAIEKSGLNTEVKVCVSGYDALDFLQNKGKYESLKPEQCRPDLVFLDINMPRLSGWGFLEAYAKLPDSELPKISIIIIMLSTSSHTETKTRALNTPYVTDFVEKPLRPDTLAALAEQYFKESIES